MVGVTHHPIETACAVGKEQQERHWEAGKGALTRLRSSHRSGNAIYCWLAGAPERPACAVLVGPDVAFWDGGNPAAGCSPAEGTGRPLSSARVLPRAESPHGTPTPTPGRSDPHRQC